MKYRKIPVVIEAMEWTGENVKEIKEFCGKAAKIHYQYTMAAPDQPTIMLVLDTLEGEMHASVGNMIIKGVKGEVYPCRRDIFDQTYEVVNDE